MKWVGLTGSLGSGKSTVADFFAELGIPIIKTDELSHELIRKGQAGFAPLLAHFGKGILDSDGEIDRKKLASKVFSNEDELKFIEQLLHPLIRNEVKQRSAKLAKQKKAPPFCIIEVPLLFETSWDHMMHASITVWCEPNEALTRASHRLHITLDEAKKRTAAQMNAEEKKRLATYVIDNSDSLEETRRQTKEVYQKLISNT